MSRTRKEKSIAIKIRASVHEKVIAHCDKTGISMIQFISDAAKEKLEGIKREHPISPNEANFPPAVWTSENFDPNGGTRRYC